MRNLSKLEYTESDAVVYGNQSASIFNFQCLTEKLVGCHDQLLQILSTPIFFYFFFVSRKGYKTESFLHTLAHYVHRTKKNKQQYTYSYVHSVQTTDRLSTEKSAGLLEAAFWNDNTRSPTVRITP